MDVFFVETSVMKLHHHNVLPFFLHVLLQVYLFDTFVRNWMYHGYKLKTPPPLKSLVAKIGCWRKKLKPRVRIWNLELKKIKTPFLKCAVGENFQHHARESRENFWGLPLENSVLGQFCARSARLQKKTTPTAYALGFYLANAPGGADSGAAEKSCSVSRSPLLVTRTVFGDPGSLLGYSAGIILCLFIYFLILV